MIRFHQLPAEDMEQVAIQQDGEWLAKFNDTLGQHMERLLGSKLGPADMPLTVTTLASLALLSEREDDLKGPNAEARYTNEGFWRSSRMWG